MADIDFQKILRGVFEKIGAKPERIVIDVLIGKGDSLKGIIVCPDVKRPYLSEEQARADLKPGQSLYKVDVYRLE